MSNLLTKLILLIQIEMTFLSTIFYANKIGNVVIL